mmetsp:Transcript_9903/g.24398  ORF Transcript_9903/g.24398 Transcript_9903/m.24398 type:complete len:105 (+) Transcript_9903:277-591(+)
MNCKVHSTAPGASMKRSQDFRKSCRCQAKHDLDESNKGCQTVKDDLQKQLDALRADFENTKAAANECEARIVKQLQRSNVSTDASRNSGLIWTRRVTTSRRRTG